MKRNSFLAYKECDALHVSWCEWVHHLLHQLTDASSIQFLYFFIPLGVFSHRFLVPGTYFYSAGKVDSGGFIKMRGQIHVIPAQDLVEELDVKIHGITANHEKVTGRLSFLFPSISKDKLSGLSRCH